ncbi:hypothetical protein FI667_g12584, partial [Globisporangium splendens]
MSEASVQVTVSALVRAPVESAWEHWTTPASITQWNAASDDWHTTKATNDLQVGGQFSSTMAAKDGSVSFDFAGTYTVVEPLKRIEYELDDHRRVSITFTTSSDTETLVEETFDTDAAHTVEQQRSGWQAIMDNYKKFTEAQQ